MKDKLHHATKINLAVDKLLCKYLLLQTSLNFWIMA